MRCQFNPFNLRYASGRQSLVRQTHTAEFKNRSAALSGVESILLRGNAAKMVNVAGSYVVTELVLQ